MTAHDTRHSTNLDVDLDKDVPCTLYRDCGRPAAWLCVVVHDATDAACCSEPSCDPHRRRMVTALGRAHLAGRSWQCVAHDLFVHITWRKL